MAWKSYLDSIDAPPKKAEDEASFEVPEMIVEYDEWQANMSQKEKSAWKKLERVEKKYHKHNDVDINLTTTRGFWQKDERLKKEVLEAQRECLKIGIEKLNKGYEPGFHEAFILDKFQLCIENGGEMWFCYEPDRFADYHVKDRR